MFTNLLLADEINRTPPKTQASLLEVMEERQVSVDGRPRPLPEPFLVAATQNPIEYEGTYLPEAQLDRFPVQADGAAAHRDEELGVIRAHHAGFDPRNLASAGVTAVATAADLDAARRAAQRVQVADGVLAYMVDLVRATRAASRTRRITAGRDRAAQRGKGVRVAERSRVRDARRRQGGGPPGPTAPGPPAPRGRDRGRHRRRRARLAARHRPDAPLMISWRVPALLLVIGTATLAACAVTGTSPWLPLGAALEVVVLLVGVDLLIAAPAGEVTLGRSRP